MYCGVFSLILEKGNLLRFPKHTLYICLSSRTPSVQQTAAQPSREFCGLSILISLELGLDYEKK